MPWFLCHRDIQIQFMQVPVTPIYDVKISYMRGQIKPKVRSKSNYPNLSFWYEIRHLGGQIKHKGADQCARQDICMKSIVPASVQSSVWQRHSWHGLLLVAPYLNKGNHDVVVMIGALHLDHLEVPDQDVLMNILARHHFSKESSTTCYYLHPLLSETSDHLWYNGLVSWTLAQSVLYRCNSQRRLGGFEGVQIWSYKTTFKICSKYQIFNISKYYHEDLLKLFCQTF